MAARAQDRFEADMKVVLNNLNTEIGAIENRTIGGLLAAGLKIQRESDLHVPREYGNLVGSSYTRRAQDDPLAVEVGYNADYALYVHENMNVKHAGEPRPSGLGVFWGPHGGPKFLERAVTALWSMIVDTIASYAKVAK